MLGCMLGFTASCDSRITFYNFYVRKEVGLHALAEDNFS